MEMIPEIPKAKTKTQWMAATQALLLLAMYGANIGWISPFLGKLNRPDPPFQATEEQLSWVASIAEMSRVIGIVAGSVATNRLGTKSSLYMCGFYFAGGWVCLICANTINIVIIYQIFCGIAAGSLLTSFSLYLGEIVNANIRGTVISFVMNGIIIGLLYGNLIGTYVDAWIFGVVNLALTGIFLITFYFFPSTPYYLINCNELEQAKKALRYYNGGVNVDKEFAKLQEFINSSPRVSFLQALRNLRKPVNLNTFFMINVVYSLVHFSGLSSTVVYLEVITMAGKIEVIRPSTLVTIMSAIAIPASWVAMSISDKYGRVTSLLFSCLVFCVDFIAWGGSFHLLELGYSPADVQWLVIVTTLVYRLNLNVGLNPVAPVLISEVFAPNVKSAATCLVNVTCAVCVFISIKHFQFMVDHITYKYMFYFNAAVVLAVGIYAKLCIPETKGKTLQEIHEMFLKKYSAKAKGGQNLEYADPSSFSKKKNLAICEQTCNEDITSTNEELMSERGRLSSSNVTCPLVHSADVSERTDVGRV